MYGVIASVHLRRKELIAQNLGQDIGVEVGALYVQAKATLRTHGIEGASARVFGQVAARKFKSDMPHDSTRIGQ